MGLSGHIHASGGGGDFSVGADVSVTTLDPVNVTALLSTSFDDFDGWSGASWPTAGDPECPNGTTEGAVNSGFANAALKATTWTPPSNGTFSLKASRGSGDPEYVTVRVKLPAPTITVTIDDGGGAASHANGAADTVSSGTVTIAGTLATGRSGGAWATSVKRGDTGASVTVTNGTNASSTFTAADAAANDGQGYSAVKTYTDPDGRVARWNGTLRVSGFNRLVAPTPPAPVALSSGTTSRTFTFTTSSLGGEGSVTFSSAITQTGSGASISSTTDNSGTVDVAVTGLTDGNTVQVALTATDSEGQTAVGRASGSVSATSPTPPVLAAPAEDTSDLDDANPSVSFTNSGGALTSSSATLFSKPSGSSATVSNSSPSLSVTLAPDKPGTYVVELTGTNADGTAKSYATFVVSALAPTAEAGANQQHSGGAKSLDGSGSSAAAGRTISAYAWTVASNSPNSATLTDADTTTPDFTAVKGETYIFQLTVTDSEGETATDTVSVFPAASVVTHYDIDLTTATADASLADGDVIYESDGTTAIGTMRIGDGLSSGTSNLLASIGSGGLEFEAELASGSYQWAHASFNLDSTNIAWSTDVVVVQLQYRVESIGSKVYEGIGATFGEDGRPRTSGSGHNWACMVIDSDVRKERAQDYSGNTAYSFGTDQATGASLPQEYVAAFVVHAGTIVYCYWRRGTTLFNGVPDPSDSDVYVQAFAETNAVGVSESKNFGNEIAVGLHGINYTAGSGNGPVAQLKRVKITSAGPGRD